MKEQDDKSSILMQKLQSVQDEPVTKSKKEEKKLEAIVSSGSALDEPVVWPHNKLEFLKPDKIKDKKGRRPDDPDYDPGTLLVPDSFLNSLSPVRCSLAHMYSLLSRLSTFRAFVSGGFLKRTILTACCSSKLASSMSSTTWMPTLE